MKKILLFVIVCISITPVYAGVLTVSNNSALPGSPGQYATVMAAANAALAGDTILVHGSPTAYSESVTINKKLIFRGPGFYPQTNSGLVASGLTFVFANNSSNSIIEGFASVAISYSNSNPLSNITIRGNSLGTFNLHSSFSNVIIENNILAGNTFLNNATDLQFRNNIVYGITYSSTSSTNVFKNNLYICAGEAFSGFTNAVISNNIFYTKDPREATNTSVTTSTYNNNLTYNNTGSLGVIPAGSNVGSGNIINADPLFIGVYSCNWSINWRLNPTSPAKNAGTDGTDIGPTGGVSPIYKYAAPYPMTGEPAMPQVQSVVMPVSSVAPGGNLNVTVKARKRN